MKSKKQDLEKEMQEQIELDPVAAGERHRSLLGMAADRALKAVNGITGDGLLKAVQADRLYVGFSHDMAEATGRRVYEVRWTIREKLSEFLKRQLLVLRGQLPPVEQSPLAKQIIQAIRDQAEPRSKIVEGESEFRRMLEENGLREADPQTYESRVRQRVHPE